ncbi:MAG: ABC transporter ATP-binding protein [Deltaproteobacteria bacterium]|nr:ABC transporter ATP-binding protein [Deltaproteobacteria bacterium]
MEGNNIQIAAKDTGNILLKIEDLHVIFETYHGTVHALSGISLDLINRKITGLVGETGCGKSVTAKAITRLITKPGKIVSGRILLDHQDLLQLPEAEMQNIRGGIISMIFQNPRAALNPVFTVEDQIHFILERHQNYKRSRSRERILDLLTEVGIADPKRRMKNYPFELSTGMCQRVMIAMALSCQPKLLIADEPTTGIDVTIQAQILELFANLVYEHGATAMLITHDLGVVAETCDFTAVMYAGKIVEIGTTDNIFQQPLHPYAKGLVKSSFSGEEIDELHYIPGTVPDLIHMEPGCSFAPRCSRKIDICRKENPDMAELSRGHRVRCFVTNRNTR